MLEMHYTWRTLPNPFLNFTDPGKTVRCRISGRYTDILNLLTGGSSAIILSGAPRIGKSGLIHYLEDTSHSQWSWRTEIAERVPGKGLKLDDTHFVQVDLRPLKTIENQDEFYHLFINQCLRALQQPYQQDAPVQTSDLKGLREYLRFLNSKQPEAQYFLMLDSIERLARPDMGLPGQGKSEGRSATERGLALLDRCRAIRVLIDLIDEFNNIGVILSIESLPRAKSVDQFTHVSADLARFTTTPLQIFSWDDTTSYLSQEAQDFDSEWAQQFSHLGGKTIFTPDEQAWILEQAGTHPYLLQQFCFNAFDFKKDYASMENWKELQENDKASIIELVTERISTFLNGLWRRLQEALEKGSPEVRASFDEFIGLLPTKRAQEELPLEKWKSLGTELRYILRSEGIIRYDRFQPIRFPGAILRKYLIQKGKETSSLPARNLQLTISRPTSEREQLPLSEIEYHLIKTLMQHPRRCPEEELMKSAWGKLIERQTFTQRMHHLRRKLRDSGGNIEFITNKYGGFYSLNHVEWLHLE
jgi:Transcriptional regulatory protein, C terminal